MQFQGDPLRKSKLRKLKKLLFNFLKDYLNYKTKN